MMNLCSWRLSRQSGMKMYLSCVPKLTRPLTSCDDACRESKLYFRWIVCVLSAHMLKLCCLHCFTFPDDTTLHAYFPKMGIFFVLLSFFGALPLLSSSTKAWLLLALEPGPITLKNLEKERFGNDHTPAYIACTTFVHIWTWSGWGLSSIIKLLTCISNICVESMMLMHWLLL